MRAGGEVRKPRADGKHEIGVVRQRVRSRRARDAYRTCLQRVVPRQRALARLCFHYRHAMGFRERAQGFGAAVAVEHAAARDDHRLLRRAQERCRDIELRGFRRRRTDSHQRRREKRLGIIVGLGLHVLRQRERDGAAQRRVGQDGNRARQRSEELRGCDDAVEIARHRLHAVVGRDAAVVKILELLQHGVGCPRNEDIARQEKHGEPIDVCGGGRRHEVRRSRADRGRARHHPLAEVRLGEGDGGVRHRLLVVRSVGRQHIPVPVERFAHAGDVAVAEDGPDAGEERHLPAVADRPLRRQETDKRLRHRQSYRRHGVSEPRVFEVEESSPISSGNK